MQVIIKILCVLQEILAIPQSLDGIEATTPEEERLVPCNIDSEVTNSD